MLNIGRQFVIGFLHFLNEIQWLINSIEIFWFNLIKKSSMSLIITCSKTIPSHPRSSEQKIKIVLVFALLFFREKNSLIRRRSRSVTLMTGGATCTKMTRRCLNQLQLVHNWVYSFLNSNLHTIWTTWAFTTCF